MRGLLANIEFFYFLFISFFYIYRNEKVILHMTFKNQLSRLPTTNPSLAAVKNLKYEFAHESTQHFLAERRMPFRLTLQWVWTWQLHAISNTWKFPLLLKQFPFPCWLSTVEVSSYPNNQRPLYLCYQLFTLTAVFFPFVRFIFAVRLRVASLLSINTLATVTNVLAVFAFRWQKKTHVNLANPPV